ncbi:hypothetical protein SCLCIDRAFT_1222396 [Scleroderma citrinum Foug A]|uniref:Uncharacterized protein n=1 Tax=Scleroderma citrinum Foug A TaxID=1036808 RepID=A0A0C2YWH8_9AGAM|nr:hypothetical protein SCLCIDRAFT_1222396 [Scleroderma citrinum Foug A]
MYANGNFVFNRALRFIYSTRITLGISTWLRQSQKVEEHPTLHSSSRNPLKLKARVIKPITPTIPVIVPMGAEGPQL